MTSDLAAACALAPGFVASRQTSATTIIRDMSLLSHAPYTETLKNIIIIKILMAKISKRTRFRLENLNGLVTDPLLVAPPGLRTKQRARISDPAIARAVTTIRQKKTWRRSLDVWPDPVKYRTRRGTRPGHMHQVIIQGIAQHRLG